MTRQVPPRMRARRGFMARRATPLRAALVAVAAAGPAFVAFVAAPTRAEARTARHFVTAGLLTGFASKLGSGIEGTLGGELDYTFYPWKPYDFGVGGFAQVHTVAFDHVRAAAGPQINYTLGGAELGLFVEQGGASYGTSLGAQITPFVSVGIVSLGFRVGIPFYALGSSPRYPVDLGLSATLKCPYPIDGSFFSLW